MNTHRYRLWAILLSAPLWISAFSQTLKPGDQAPPLLISSWVKGLPVALHKGSTFVIDFWSPSSPECSRTIPKISELARSLRGQVEFLGVAIRTTDKSKVKAYVAKMRDAMDYAVAIDQTTRIGRSTSAELWLNRAGMGAPRFLPTSFVVGKDGHIKWIGSSFDLPSVLAKVLDPRWNVQEFATMFKVQQDRMNKEFVLRHDPNLKRLADAKASLDAKNYRLAIHELNEILATKHLKSQVAAGVVVPLKCSAYRSLNDIDGYYADSIRTSLAWSQDPHVLNALAWDILNPESRLRIKNYPLALSYAKNAVRLSNRLNANMLDTLAWACWKTGNRSAAVASEKAALAIGKQPDKTEMTLTLAKFSKAQPNPHLPKK
jgi:thiol-disulfide isomerase/thioredoxin